MSEDLLDNQSSSPDPDTVPTPEFSNSDTKSDTKSVMSEHTRNNPQDFPIIADVSKSDRSPDPNELPEANFDFESDSVSDSEELESEIGTQDETVNLNRKGGDGRARDKYYEYARNIQNPYQPQMPMPFQQQMPLQMPMQMPMQMPFQQQMPMQMPFQQMPMQMPLQPMQIPLQQMQYQNNMDFYTHNLQYNFLKENKSKLSYYITVELDLYPGTEVSGIKKYSLKCQSTFERIRKSLSDLFGYQYKPLEIKEAYEYEANFEKNEKIKEENEKKIVEDKKEKERGDRDRIREEDRGRIREGERSRERSREGSRIREGDREGERERSRERRGGKSINKSMNNKKRPKNRTLKRAKS